MKHFAMRFGKNLHYLITGGTGFLGQQMTRYLLTRSNTDVIRIFSRDEYKQALMRETFQNDPRLRFFLGDVRDEARLEMAMRGCDIVIHAAALKRIEAVEYNVFEAIQTNILGSQCVIKAALAARVKVCVLVSSDKACEPINSYGLTKAIAERLFTEAAYNHGDPDTRFVVVRYGNVWNSRGSVLEQWHRQRRQHQTLTVTIPNATRFFLSVEQAIATINAAIDYAESGDIVVPSTLPAYHLRDLIQAFVELYPTSWIESGIRPGEKIHECLLSEAEVPRTLAGDPYAFVHPLVSNHPRQHERDPHLTAFTSDQARRLSIEELKEQLGEASHPLYEA